jgi:predicted KAP-like P-loop ATPase
LKFLDGPALEYEQLRRKIETQARELSYFTTDQLNKISTKLSNEDKLKWQNVLHRFADQNRSVFQIYNNKKKHPFNLLIPIDFV